MRAITALVVLATISSFHVTKTEADPLRLVQFEQGADPFKLRAAAEDILKEIFVAFDGKYENPAKIVRQSMYEASDNYDEANISLNDTIKYSMQDADADMYRYLKQAIVYVKGVKDASCKKDSKRTFQNISATLTQDLVSKCESSARSEADERLNSSVEWINGKLRQAKEYLKNDSDLCSFGFGMDMCVSKIKRVFYRTTRQVSLQVQRDCNYMKSLGKEMEACSEELMQTAVNKIEKETDRVSKCILNTYNDEEDDGYTTEPVPEPNPGPNPAPYPVYNPPEYPEPYPGSNPGSNPEPNQGPNPGPDSAPNSGPLRGNWSSNGTNNE